jgi:hypothetical protein
MTDEPVRLTIVAVLVFLASFVSGPLSAQPAPSFQARCSELKESMAALKGQEERELVTIEVVGLLEIVREQNGLAFLGMCGPPHPRVLCITYESNGRQPGERVVVVGTIQPTGEDFIQLDPCLHYTPTPEDKD